MPYCQDGSIRRWAALTQEHADYCAPAHVTTAAVGINTELRVVMYDRAAVAPVRLKRQTGLPCYVTIICVSKLTRLFDMG